MSIHDLSRWKGRPPPERVTLEGEHVTIVPLSAADHARDLYALINHSGEESIWDYMPYGPFETFEALAGQMKTWQAASDPLYYTILSKGDGKPVGAFSLMRINPAHGTIEIGGIWFTSKLRRTVAATEALYLLIHYAMTTLGYRRLEWKCNNLNEASKRAAKRLGFTFEGVFRQHMVLKDKNRDTAWFSILDSEWPAIEAAFQAWLDPDNFDEKEVQRKGLGEFIKETKGEK